MHQANARQDHPTLPWCGALPFQKAFQITIPSSECVPLQWMDGHGHLLQGYSCWWWWCTWSWWCHCAAAPPQIDFWMKSETQVPETLEDAIRKAGAPIGLMSNNAKSELHGWSKDLLCMCEVKDQQSAPDYQYQNPAERKMQDVKKTMNLIMDHTGCPSKWCLLCALFVIMLMNVLPNANGEIPQTQI